MVDSRLSQRTITPGKKKETPNLSLGRTPAAFSFLKRRLNSYILTEPWGISSAGRARPSQGRGRRFDPAMLHHSYRQTNHFFITKDVIVYYTHLDSAKIETFPGIEKLGLD